MERQIKTHKDTYKYIHKYTYTKERLTQNTINLYSLYKRKKKDTEEENVKRKYHDAVKHKEKFKKETSFKILRNYQEKKIHKETLPLRKPSLLKHNPLFIYLIYSKGTKSVIYRQMK